jgi:hypothetical protein
VHFFLLINQHLELQVKLTKRRRNPELRVVNCTADAGGGKAGVDCAAVCHGDTGHEQARHNLAQGTFVVNAQSAVVSGDVVV